jgi:uracil-DNA glycosylase
MKLFASRHEGATPISHREFCDKLATLVDNDAGIYYNKEWPKEYTYNYLLKISKPKWQKLFGTAAAKSVIANLISDIMLATTDPKALIPKDPFVIFSVLDIDEINVVILGQDPYPTPGMASGFAFSLPKKYRGKIPPSLINIYKELLRENEIPVMPKYGNLDNWTQQGVFLYNVALAFIPDEAKNSRFPNNMMKIFANMTAMIISAIKPAVALLWGRHAQSIEFNESVSILKSPHPSPLTTGFIGNDHFKNANKILTDNGLKAIDWNI